MAGRRRRSSAPFSKSQHNQLLERDSTNTLLEPAPEYSDDVCDML